VQRVRAAGGQAQEPRPEPYGLIADCVDDQGVPFALVQSSAGSEGERAAAGDARHGDVAYLVLEVVDSSKTRAFFGSVLGWRFTPGRAEDGWEAQGVVPMVGVLGGQEQPAVVAMYRVDDIAHAVERVRSAGGTATEPERQPYGLSSTCTDDQGTRFFLGQL
jgi:predicted enzyme related to lactoylglutathione lyase